jgi:hypothetical protein
MHCYYAFMTSAYVIDGSVLCCDDRTKIWNFERLEIAIKQVEELMSAGDELKVFVDASLPFKLSGPDKQRLEQFITKGKITKAPAGVQADGFILRWAEERRAIVITNDLYRDYVNTFPWINETGSGRFVCGDYDDSTKRWTFLERHAGTTNARTLEQIAKTSIATAPHKTNIGYEYLRQASNYMNPVDRANPTAIVFLLDQSLSMNEEWSHGVTKAQKLAEVVNGVIKSMVLQCTKSAGAGSEVRPYFDVAIFGYGGNAVESLLKSTDSEKPFLSISDVSKLADIQTTTVGDRVKRVPIWVHAHAGGATPMNSALRTATKVLDTWTKEHKNSFPPIVFNITDGESTDGNPIDSGSRLTEISTTDGNVLLFTAHISKESHKGLKFPEYLDPNEPEYAHVMFNITSLVPTSMANAAEEIGIPEITPASRGFLFNSSASDVISMLNLGTMPSQRA